MAQKLINVPGIGQVTFQKRRNTGSIRLHIQGSRVKVTLPARLPYSFAQKYLISKKDWVEANLKPNNGLLNGDNIGKNHKLIVANKDISRPSTKLSKSEIRVNLPRGLDQAQSEAQRVITKACERALMQEAEEFILPRLADLAYEHHFEVKSSSIKRLRSRWGSCDQNRHITLNSYLIQLPWKLIDYVLIHELSHTKHLNHSPAFWNEVANILPDYKQLRKETKTHSPHVITT